MYADIANTNAPRYDRAAGLSGSAIWSIREWENPNNILYPISFGYHKDGRRIPSLTMEALGGAGLVPRGTTRMQFIVPIYSGLIGLLMPEKKLLPLNLLPLDIEIVFNPHALYSS